MTPRRAAALLLAIFSLGCSSQPPAPVTVENVQKIAATVDSIDLAKRLVALRAENGLTTAVEVGPEVRNLAQVQVGDHVVVRYYQAVAAQLKPKGESATLGTIAGADGTVRAAPGERPAAAAGRMVTTTVVIDAVDRASNTVVFRGPGGMLRSVSVVDADARKFIGGLKQGDEVEVTFTEALAISVEPAS